MYWAHLIYSLILVLVAHIDHTGGTKPGYLDFDNLPETNFSCNGKVIGGYYADVETGCQMFHVCTIGQKAEVTDIKFLCLNGTVFDQETRVCERIDEVDCSKSEDFFGLNLELYGNNGQLGIQPENEFDCEDCSTEDDYDDTETTTFTTTTSTTTTTTRPTTTTPRPTTKDPKIAHFASSSPQTIAALLALHNAFTQSLQHNPKVKPPPPRVINNAFAQTDKPTSKPFYITQRPTIHYSSEGHSYGTLSPIQRPKPLQQFYHLTTPSPLKSNYHHFQSGDTSFGHSFDSNKPYNFQFFHSRKVQEPIQKSSISVVTSTSTSTSIKTSKPNETTIDFPTGYDEYQDEEIDDPFFHDVPKLRSKRSDRASQKDEFHHPNHKYPETEHFNHRYHEIKEKSDLQQDAPQKREEFLQNLLGSLDMDEHDRQKMVNFFIREEEQMGKTGGMLQKLGDKLGKIIMDDINKTLHSSHSLNQNKSHFYNLDELSKIWKQHYEEMNVETQLNFSIDDKRKKRGITDIETESLSKQDSKWKSKYEANATDIEYIDPESENGKDIDKRQIKGIDSERLIVEYEPKKKQKSRTPIRTTTKDLKSTTKDQRNTVKDLKSTTKDVRPVSEEIDEGDFTTLPYRRSSVRGRTRNSRVTDSVLSRRRQIKFNYETTTQIIPPERPGSHVGRSQARHRTNNATRSQLSSKLRDWTVPVYEEEHNESPSLPLPLTLQESGSHVNEATQTTMMYIAQTNVPKRNITRSRGRVRGTLREPTSTTTIQPTTDMNLKPDPNFSCEGKIKGGFYADIASDCRGFFICSQGQINGPLLKSHFWCGATTKFNQRSRTCQADYLVECSVSPRYYHLNNDFAIPESEDDLKGKFEPMKV